MTPAAGVSLTALRPAELVPAAERPVGGDEHEVREPEAPRTGRRGRIFATVAALLVLTVAVGGSVSWIAQAQAGEAAAAGKTVEELRTPTQTPIEPAITQTPTLPFPADGSAEPLPSQSAPRITENLFAERNSSGNLTRPPATGAPATRTPDTGGATPTVPNPVPFPTTPSPAVPTPTTTPAPTAPVEPAPEPGGEPGTGEGEGGGTPEGPGDETEPDLPPVEEEPPAEPAP